jgi:hypothetical protein
VYDPRVQRALQGCAREEKARKRAYHERMAAAARRSRELAAQEAERKRARQILAEERAREEVERAEEEAEESMHERIEHRKEVIKAKVLSRCVGTMKTNACSLRARNECALLIEAYKMPGDEYLAFGPVASSRRW